MVDDEWIVDDNAPKEDDGHYNVNNVLQPHEITKSTSGETSTGHKVAGSSSSSLGSNSAEGALKEAPTVSAGGEGAPLLSKDQSAANLAREIPDVTPDPDRPVTRSLPQNDGATASQPEEKDSDVPGAFPETPANEPSSFGVAPLPATGHQNTQSSVTTSKEDYENAGGEGTAGGDFSTQPVLEPGTQDLGSGATTSKEDYDKVGSDTTPDEQVSINPLPATGHDDIQSSVTTSKDDYDKIGSAGADDQQVSVDPIPATGHDDIQSSVTTSKDDYEKIGSADADDQQVSVNPIPATGHDDIQSSVTTSKEDYEKAGAFGLAGAAVAGTGAAIGSAFSKPKDNEKNIIPESSLPMNPEKTDTTDTGPFLSSVGPGSTTADLASKVPLEPKREAQVIDPSGPEAPEPSKQASAIPFIASSGPGTTTADLASKVPLEQKREGVDVDSETVAEKSALEKELLQKVPESQATGEPASAAKSQTSYYGLATSVPHTVEESIAKAHASPEAATESSVVAEKSALEKELLQRVPASQATGEPASAALAQTSYGGLAAGVPVSVEESIAKAHASPEAATESSVVAEKSALERELQAKVPVEESAGEPAPTLSAATATTAPGESSTAAATTASLTDGKTANEPVPGTDTSTQHQGLSAGEIAGGAAVGGAAAAGAATLAAKHEDKDVEPPRVDDSQKPPVTTESAPATIHGKTEPAPATTAGIGSASPIPGVSPTAGAALSDGTEDPTVADEPSAPKTKAPVETSEATATEYAPPRAEGVAPGVSPSAAAALSDGTEDPTLADEPAVKMMTQNEAGTTAPAYDAVTTDPTTSGADTPGVTSTAPTLPPTVTSAGTTNGGQATSAATETTKAKERERDPSPMTRPGESSTAGKTPETPKKAVAGPAAVGTTPGSTASTPAKSTTESSVTGDKKRKKRHRLSQIIKKIFD